LTRHLLVIGAQRSGTTYLHHVLDQHPEITMARPAAPEPKVFLSDALVERGARWYQESYFAHATDERLLGEKSTSYLEDPAASARVAQMLDAPLILAVLRDPVSRAVSNWRFSTDNGYETRPLDEALRSNLDGDRDWDPRATSVSPYAYLQRGRYASYLEPWLERFGADVHVMFFEELTADDAAVRRLYADLGVDPGHRAERVGQPVNESTAHAEAVPEGLRERLDEYFEPSDRALERLLGRGVPWAQPHTSGEPS
jgi:hypothetical protein